MEHIIQIFENTVQLFPEKTAVAYKEQKLSFGELRIASMTIAAEILNISSQTKQPVAVIVNRGVDTMVGFLAVLYSGNYYVPIDPEMPCAKQQAILDDCQPVVLLCGDAQKEILENIRYDGQILPITWDEKASLKGDELFSVTYEEDDPIYMVYTSGSTGKPKGVLKSHRAVCSFAKAFAAEFGLGDEEIIGNQTPFFFDASAKDIFLMMYTGATLEIIPSELFMYPPKLIMYLNERKISYICWVPTALAMVTQLATFKQVMPEYLKRVFFVGEVFPIKQLRKWIEALPDITYVNLYGSTELSGISLYYTIDTSRPLEMLPMGKPLSNCRVFLMDPEKGILIREKGVNGEVCVISDALALEYFHDPEKTSAVFTYLNPHQIFGEDEDFREAVKVLHTGDLASYDENGDLVFATRKDFQIKLMGRRIELGEIEAAADKMEVIQRCACVFDQEKKKICMYCELIPDCDWNGKMVKEELKNRLSDYMVPASVKIMEKLPLNANGKIDRNALKSL